MMCALLGMFVSALCDPTHVAVFDPYRLSQSCSLVSLQCSGIAVECSEVEKTEAVRKGGMEEGREGEEREEGVVEHCSADKLMQQSRLISSTLPVWTSTFFNIRTARQEHTVTGQKWGCFFNRLRGSCPWCCQPRIPLLRGSWVELP